MTKCQFGFIVALLIASIAFVVVPFVVYFGRRLVAYLSRRLFAKPKCEPKSKSGVSRMLIFSAFLIGSVWCLRYAVGYFGILFPNLSTITPDTSFEGLTWWEEVFNSMIHALQTFSMDEDYTAYIISGKTMLREMFGAESVLQTAYGIYASVLNFVAPIAGGAVIFEILASIFPKIRLHGSYLTSWRKKYYFSELNDASLSLANSIKLTNISIFKKPVIIFTDTYIDDEEEKGSELLLEAKRIGAICVRDDLSHVAKPRFGKREYYLMDENEFGNLQTLMGLTETHNLKFIRNSFIYLFVQSDAYVQIEKRINSKLNDKSLRKIFKNDNEKPIVVPINGYRNLVSNLFRSIPLYEPLVNKPNSSNLTLTILGNGMIGTEAFLSAYWFGQIMVSCVVNGQNTMTECNMTINVVSQDAPDKFWSKIDYVNPEIKQTIEVIDSSSNKPVQEKCVYDKVRNKNNPYCKVRYIQSDVKIGDFWDMESDEIRPLFDSNYFVVALGSDADNISVAEKLRCAIGKKHLETNLDEFVDKVVISYAVFNPKLSSTLNEQSHYQCRERGKSDIFMYSFGSLDQVYSCDNVYMSKSKLQAEETGNAYSHIKDNKDRMKNKENGNYNYWADLARAMHIKYKAFSLGLIEQSIFDFMHNQNPLQVNEEYAQQQCGLYRRICLAIKNGVVAEDIKELYDNVKRKTHCLAWLEHRRWNAFTRTMGYQHTSEFRRNLQLNGKNHKNMELKLHPCLVETRKTELTGDNRYLIEEVKRSLDFPKRSQCDWGATANEKIEFLKARKELFEDKLAKLRRIDKGSLDPLDKFSCDWGIEAFSVNISNLTLAIDNLEKGTDIKLDDIVEIGCCDYKEYDYCIYDFFN